MGWGGASVEAAHLALCGFSAAAAAYKQAHAAIFVDIRAAYDSAWASLALPSAEGREAIFRAVLALGFSVEEAAEIAIDGQREQEWGGAPRTLLIL